jgi:hypothetical protein
MTLELWAFRAEVRTEGADLRGMAVQALDGGIGKVEDVVERESRTFLLVDTGPWIFGKTIKLPAGLVAGVDPEQGIILVDRPKDDVKDAPDQDGDLVEDSAHADALTRHYADGARHEAPPAAGPSAPVGPPAATALGGAVATPDAAEEPGGVAPTGARDDAAPTVTEAPEPERPEPQRPEPPTDDAPSRRSALATGAPPDAEERVPEQPAPKDEPAPEPPRRRAAAPSRGRTAERPDRAPAQGRPKAPSRPTPAPKPAEAASRATSTDTEKATRTRARGESAPAPAKRQARSGAASRDAQPIARYDALTAAEVVGRLRALTQSELAKVERYEKRGEGRQTILKRVASLREKEPWRGYDSATVKEVRERLARAKADRVTAVRDYERRHRNRTGVMDAARRRLDDNT